MSRTTTCEACVACPLAASQDQLDHPGVDALWTTAEELGIVINVLIHLNLADELEALLQRHPGLRVVLDHCMYPRGKDGLAGETIRRVLRLARYPNLLRQADLARG